MDKNVLVSISGLQFMEGDKDTIELIVAGDYYKKNGKHYIIYEEIGEDFPGTTKNTIKVYDGGMEVIKNGPSCTHMSFRQNEKSFSNYVTPLGELMVGIQTKDIVTEEEEDSLLVKVSYGLDINYQHVSDCDIVIKVRSKNKEKIWSEQ